MTKKKEPPVGYFEEPEDQDLVRSLGVDQPDPLEPAFGQFMAEVCRLIEELDASKDDPAARAAFDARLIACLRKGTSAFYINNPNRPAWERLGELLTSALNDETIASNALVTDTVRVFIRLVLNQSLFASSLKQAFKALDRAMQIIRGQLPRRKRKTLSTGDLLAFRENWMAVKRRDSDRGWKAAAKAHFSISDRTLKVRLSDTDAPKR